MNSFEEQIKQQFVEATGHTFESMVKREVDEYKQHVAEAIEECTCQHTDKVVWKKKLKEMLGISDVVANAHTRSTEREKKVE